MFKCTAVFQANYYATEKVLINQGGTSSSKTFSIMQILFLRAIEKKRTITVTGESLPNLRKGAYRDAETIYSITKELQKHVVSWNKTDRIILFKNGSLIEFVSNLDEQSAKNGKRDILFANEGNGISWPIFWQLAIRTREQIFIDYNPSAPAWPHEKLIGTNENTNDLSASVKLIISDHRHNCFLSEDEHRKIEGIKDKELWNVYARGMTGNLTGLIFTHFKEIPTDNFPNEEVFYGLDFGYENDPTALVKCCANNMNGYVDEVAYQSGDIPPRRILQLLKDNGYRGETVFCEHDPEQIAQLRALGVMAIPARKGNGSIKAGIQKLKEFNMYYTARSVNLKEELKRYMWEIDPITGKPTNTPKSGFDHEIDSIRYAFFTKFFRI